MSKYILNPEYKTSSVEDILSKLIEFSKEGSTYNTLNGAKQHKVKKVKEDKIVIVRLNANKNPELTIVEITEVIKLFKKGDRLNAFSESYKNLLTNPINKTALLSLLNASKIIIPL